MGEVIRFISESERERIRIIQDARALYHSIFPPADPISEQRDNPFSGTGTNRSSGVPLS